MSKPNDVINIGYRYLATGDSFASLHFEYLLGETAVWETVRDCCNGIWNCLKATEMLEKTENDWVHTANDFYRRTQFPNCIGAVEGKHVRIKIPTGSGSLFCTPQTLPYLTLGFSRRKLLFYRR